MRRRLVVIRLLAIILPERLSIKVVPGSSCDAIAGWLGNELKVRVSAAPEKGKANKAVERVVADSLGLPVKNVTVVSGQTNPRKVLEIEGIDKATLNQQLSRPG